MVQLLETCASKFGSDDTLADLLFLSRQLESVNVEDDEDENGRVKAIEVSIESLMARMAVK